MRASSVFSSSRSSSMKAVSLNASRHCFRSRCTAPRILATQASQGTAPGATASPALNRPKPASAAQVAKAQPPPPPVSPAALADAYKRAEDAKSRSETVEVKVAGLNEGGLVVQYGVLRGFMPYNKVDPARLRACVNGDMSTLLGQQLKARVITVDAGRKELVLSERQVTAARALSRIQPGQVIECVVTTVEDYGAFVQLKNLSEVSGLIHKSEVSWDRIMTIDQVVSPGQELRAKVLSVDPANCRVALSLKQLTADPLRLSLDDLTWGAPAEGAETDPKIAALLEALTSSPGVDSVAVTRSAQDPHHVAQELEMYLTRSDTEGEYTAVARAGVNATELRLGASTLSREQVKQMLQRVVAKAAAQ